MRYVALLLGLGFGGCSQLVDAEDLAVRCERPMQGQTDPCQELGMRCGTASVCEVCEPSNERCNGTDDDCDGEIDEGQDLDGDGYTWCGGTVRELADCDDKDPDIRPAGILDNGERERLEVCDGKDNDCNGEVDDLSECERADCRDEPCPSDLTCDVRTGVCVAPRSTGAQCDSDVECQNGFCVEGSLLGIGGGGDRDTASFCGSACCRDSDCGSDEVCVVASNGVRACVPGNQAGVSRAGASCDADADCASGACVRGSCAASCTSDADCSEGDQCGADIGVFLADGVTAWVCGPTIGRNEVGEFCIVADPTSCVSNKCLGIACTAPCGTSADCPDDMICEFVSDSESRFPACIPRGSGQTTCCTDTDCPEGERCRPVGSTDSWSMYCQ